MGLHKAYSALYRDIYMKILEGYRVVLRTSLLLHTYWYQLTVVVRASRYCAAACKGFRGMTHGELLSLTIFNVVVDAVVCHWV